MGEITSMSLVDWLDDLTVRFLLNLPASELSSVPRLCFQVEEAQWFYEDFIRPAAAAAGKPLPSLPLRQFCLQLFQHCPLLSGFTDAQHIAAYEEFLAYKVRVPVRGAILMDETMEKLVLVKGWKKSASWSFPRGKINKDEKDLDCAIREVYEETGFDVRGAGLIPANPEDVKFIDVTMREQHMRLFVFRNVREDTHFEPQTRKEISKIAWYNVRDLPGFKKQKHGAPDQAHHANKFYMVAPFLGPLKKWVGQQKRVDAQQDAQTVAPGNEMAHANVEDETEALEEPLAEQALDPSADLRRLLSIGGLTQAPPSQPTQQSGQPPPVDGGRPNNLLAMLQGSGPRAQAGLPQTPFEQINAFPPKPESPHPHHARQTSIPYQQPVPQFPFGPTRTQQQAEQHNFTVPTPGIFGNGGFAQGPQHPFVQPPQQYPNMQHQLPQQHNLLQRPMSGHQSDVPFGIPQRRPFKPPFQNQPQIPPQPAYQPQAPLHFSRNSDALMAPQGPQGVISGGPAAPKAENLPMPRLSAHSLSLLDTFRSGGPQQPSASGKGQGAARQPSQHQSALLDLFRKSSTTPSGAQGPAPEIPPSPTSTEATVRPPQAPIRKSSTINEITRTLPTSFKRKSSSASQHPTLPVQPTTQPSSPSSMQPKLPSPQSLERPSSSGQLYDPSTPSTGPRSVHQAPANNGLTTLPKVQQPPPHHAQRPAKAPKSKHASPSRQPFSGKVNENGTPHAGPQPPFKILARPDSMRAQKYPALQAEKPPSSPLRHETPKPSNATQNPAVQLLKRPESVDPITVQKVAEIVEEHQDNAAPGFDKRDQLLALFGRSGTASPPATQAPLQMPAQEAPKTNLLDLFVANKAPVPDQPRRPAQPPAMKPPPPPQLKGERQASSQNIQHHRQQTPQNALLDLFNRPSAPAVNKLDSPGTPISPFALGTPATRQPPTFPSATNTMNPSAIAEDIRSGSGAALTPTPIVGEASRSRLGSMASANGVGSASESRKGSGSGTPVEAKGFLLDYLNGVVAKEGGGRGPRRH
ncbi:mRNA-decapping enzyme subunit 2 [Recurvomyces mirabilis]|uniref:mRNA-decapping enzyme subunit 2 n=1 Tax=Recurvomyces mirabilis TaxID=574656 RepID=A0AAE1C6H3_9PEZI|nr:mRNA-decapping enzyme subunit 2 [Recurvomyces mirabilis]KAK5162122.1 mRNA-decapping enzyme subunit 2 [Recurvomyces mirabilis]